MLTSLHSFYDNVNKFICNTLYIIIIKYKIYYIYLFYITYYYIFFFFNMTLKF